MRIAIVQFGHLASTRFPNKLLKLLGGITLIERAFQWMQGLASNHRLPNVLVQPMLACPVGDQALVRLADTAHIKCLKLPQPLASSERWTELMSPCLGLFREYDWLWDMNIACHPYLSLETGIAILRRCVSESQVVGDESISAVATPFVVAIARRDLIWDSNGHCLSGFGQLANTKRNPVIYSPAHLGYCWPTKILEPDERKLAVMARPFPLSLTRAEQIDIDTEEDFELATALYAARYREQSLHRTTATAMRESPEHTNPG